MIQYLLLFYVKCTSFYSVFWSIVFFSPFYTCKLFLINTNEGERAKIKWGQTFAWTVFLPCFPNEQESPVPVLHQVSFFRVPFSDVLVHKTAREEIVNLSANIEDVTNTTVKKISMIISFIVNYVYIYCTFNYQVHVHLYYFFFKTMEWK